jgi:hypothetical protein
LIPAFFLEYLKVALGLSQIEDLSGVLAQVIQAITACHWPDNPLFEEVN